MSIAVYSAQQTQQLFDLFSAMTDYYAGDPARINHFVKVHAYARQIGLAEQLDADTLFLLEAAALQGYWKAWNDLGQFHDRHVKDNNPLLKPYIDDKKSISCYRKSMEAGYPDSMNRLAYFYYLGDGVPKDEKEGIRLFKKAFSCPGR